MNNVDPTGKAMINAVCAAIDAIAGWYFHVIGRDRFKYHIQVSKSTWDILKKLLG